MPESASSLLLPPEAFARRDEAPDAEFYRFERLVTHIDDAAVAAVTQLYRQLLPPGGAILDLMSSWVSHLPAEVTYGRVAGLGMNARELAQNPRLTEYMVQDLNEQPELLYPDEFFDAAVICVSVQYLTQPVAVFKSLHDVMQMGAPLIVTFSNRCFPDKAVYAWQALDDAGHVGLVKHYLEAAGFGPAEVYAHRPKYGDPLYGVVARTPANS
jgi:hypothetical protein